MTLLRQHPFTHRQPTQGFPDCPEVPDYLDLAGSAAARITAGTLAEFVGVLAIPLTAVFVFPLLKHHNEPLALTYVTLRTIEAIPLLLVQGAIFATIDVSQLHLGANGAVDWPTVGAAIQALREGPC